MEQFSLIPLAGILISALLGLAVMVLDVPGQSSDLNPSHPKGSDSHAFDAADGGIVTASLDGHITHADGSIRGILGVLPSHLIGRRLDDLGLSLLGPSDIPSSAHAVSIELITRLAESGREVTVCTPGPDTVRRRLAIATRLAKTGAGDVLSISLRIAEPDSGIAQDRYGCADIAGEREGNSESSVLGPSPGSSTRALKVLYLDHTSKLSGGEIALVRALATIDKKRVTPSVLLADDGPLVERLREIGIETVVLPLSERVRNIRKDSLRLSAAARIDAPFRLLGYAIAIARYAREHNIDVIHTNSLKSDLYGGLAGRLARVPVVWHVRDYIDPSYLPRPTVTAFRALARFLPSHIIANSESTREKLALNGHKPSHVIPSGFDFGPDEDLNGDAHVHPAASTGQVVRIGIVGRLASWKGQHVFLDAAARVLGSGHAVRFSIVGAAMFGEEEYEKQLHRQVEALGIADYVEFLGFRNDVQSILRSLDILVHASVSPEPFGQVVVEGMAAGIPVIGSSSGGVPEIITHRRNGLLVSMGDANALAAAITELLECPSLAAEIGQAGYWHVRQHFKASTTSARMISVYHTVLASKKRAAWG